VLNNLSIFFRQNQIISNFETSDSWVVLSEIEKSIKCKVERAGVPLKDWDIQINYGIKTGYNEAFIIDGSKKKELIDEDPKSAEIIRPLLRGRDIKRYSYEFADLHLITTFPSLKIDINCYPAIKQHLMTFGYNRLKQTGDTGSRKKTNNQWYETQDSISYWEDFYKQKIIYPGLMRISKGDPNNFPRFTLDDSQNFFFGNDCYFIVGEHLEYLWAFLNSNLLGYLFRYYIYSFDETGYKIFTDYFENIPLPLPDSDSLQELNALIKTGAPKDQINTWIYKALKFDDNEINEIEESRLTISR